MKKNNLDLLAYYTKKLKELDNGKDYSTGYISGMQSIIDKEYARKERKENNAAIETKKAERKREENNPSTVWNQMNMRLHNHIETQKILKKRNFELKVQDLTDSTDYSLNKHRLVLVRPESYDTFLQVLARSINIESAMKAYDEIIKLSHETKLTENEIIQLQNNIYS